MMAVTQLSFEIANPRELSSADLHEALKNSIRCEMRMVGYIVELIREIDCRRLYLEYGCTSLFSYLTDVAGYTAGPAQARIDAARLMNDVPTIADDLRDGSINLTQVSIVAQSIRQKAKEAPQAKPSAQEKRELFEAIKTCDIAQSQRVVAEKLDIEVKTFERKATQQDGSLRAEMTFSPDEQKQIARLKELLSHTMPGASIQEVLMAAATDYLKRKDPLMKATKPKIRKCSNQASTAQSAALGNSELASSFEIASESEVEKSRPGATMANLFENSPFAGEIRINSESTALSGFNSAASEMTAESEVLERASFATAQLAGLHSKLPPMRSHISRTTTRLIHQRDQCCQWRDRLTGKTCGSRFQPQIDHIQPVWAGGGNEANNLQILCAAHNRMKYRTESGTTARR